MTPPARDPAPAGSGPDPIVGRANRDGTALFRDWFDDLGKAGQDVVAH